LEPVLIEAFSKLDLVALLEAQLAIVLSVKVEQSDGVWALFGSG
jgi:hypothetical protein